MIFGDLERLRAGAKGTERGRLKCLCPSIDRCSGLGFHHCYILFRSHRGTR